MWAPAAALRSWWHRARTAGVAGGRTTGPPTSANGASSLHLHWAPAEPAPTAPPSATVGAEVTLEVLEPPGVDRLYFWALQVDWVDERGRAAGGAHVGLQWHPAHPGGTAVNWGGYGPDGRELDGSASPLPSATGNPNTRDLGWRPGVPYRIAVRRSPGDRAAGDGGSAWTAWTAAVTGPDGVEVVVRDLWCAGTSISGVTMWSEVFARCDDPTTAVRWSLPRRRRADGSADAPPWCRTGYQSRADGGCANTDSSPDGSGLVQRTATTRLTPPGTRLPVPGYGR